ncbi:SAM-dependent methyltransferase [Sphingorhabdus rigui]|uniref:SAM-dependent methyltransferase n=1 Tax=Sphingorhabdus rigui TaxID=1282858 RepID=A0A840B496_9SPHN|nr:class I SAM-dependent methyltransferase [Sphingorhabdus rigui]MBB3943996.1 SAM-dependent methyltransferase [Sphingorhabdus rigui]
MFFPSLIKSIRKNDRVLEVGPGMTPHPRSDTLLEYEFSQAELVRQRGGADASNALKDPRLVFYNGESFPFDDNTFDYVIASHVIEHVPNPEKFIREVFRVGGGRGYIEFPLPSYELMFDFDVHLNFVWYDEVQNSLNYVSKNDTGIEMFSTITAMNRDSLRSGWDDIVRNNLKNYAQGIEFHEPFAVNRQSNFSGLDLKWTASGVSFERRAVRYVERVFRRFKQ